MNFVKGITHHYEENLFYNKVFLQEHGQALVSNNICINIFIKTQKNRQKEEIRKALKKIIGM